MEQKIKLISTNLEFSPFSVHHSPKTENNHIYSVHGNGTKSSIFNFIQGHKAKLKQNPQNDFGILSLSTCSDLLGL